MSYSTTHRHRIWLVCTALAWHLLLSSYCTCSAVAQPLQEWRRQVPLPLEPDSALVLPVDKATVEGLGRVLIYSRRGSGLASTAAASPRLHEIGVNCGIGLIAANLALSGPASMKRQQFLATLDSHGMRISSQLLQDVVVAQIVSRSADAAGARKLLLMTLKNPRLDKVAVERARDQALEDLQQAQKDSVELARSDSLSRAIPHVAATSSATCLAELRDATHESIVGAVDKVWKRPDLIWASAGDFTAESASNSFELFSSGKPKKLPRAIIEPETTTRKKSAKHFNTSLNIIDKASSGDVALAMTWPVPLRGPALDVFNRLFGGMYASRVNLLLREKLGWTYFMRSEIVEASQDTAIVLSGFVTKEHVGDAISVIFNELEAVCGSALTEAEVEMAKSAASYFHLRSILKVDDAAISILAAEMAGQLTEWKSYHSALSRVDSRDVQQRCNEVRSSQPTTTVVGSKRQLAPQLEDVQQVR